MRSLCPVFLASACLSSCLCGAPPTSATLHVDGNDVDVDGDDGTIRVTRDGIVAWDLRADDLAVSAGDARYFMEFGMFDIVEDFDDVVRADGLRITSVREDGVDFDVLRGDERLAVGRVGAAGGAGGGVELIVSAEGAGRVIVGTRCAPDHHFLGLGAQTHDVDHRGQIVPLWVSEQGIGKTDDDELPVLWQVVGRRHTTHVPMPAFVRSDAVAVIVDTSAFARFDLCATDEDTASFEVWDASARVVILPDVTPLRAQQRLSAALGRPRLLPPLALAPWNDAIFSEENVLEFATFLRDNEIPSSVIWTEDWRGGEDDGPLYRLDEDWRLDRRLYPNYERMAAALRAQGFMPTVYFNTFVASAGDVFDEVDAAGHGLVSSITGETVTFPGPDRDTSPTTLLDLSNDAARTYMKEEHLKEALRLGARGWMADFSEWMPVDEIALKNGEDPALFHNRYPVEWARLNREALTEANVLDEAVVFMRAGHLGSPPLVDVLWAGDQRTSFQPDDGFPTVLPIGIGSSTTGFGWFTHDIGGYQSSTNPPTNKELFFRWTTLGAFTAVMRTHHSTHARQAHNLRSDAETTAHYKRYAEIHVRLYPYLRALARALSATDEDADDVATGHGSLPFWVPMPLLFPDDEASWSIKDQVFLGPSLLVAPVITEGALARTVHLPAGRFVPFPMPGAGVGTFGASREAFLGPTDIEVDAPLGEIPVLMPAGAIVPMTATPAQTLVEVEGDTIPDLSSTTGDRLVVVALGKSGRFVEEDGASYVLEGDSTTLPAGVDDEGVIEIVGDQVVSATGLTFTTSGHPQDRVIRVMFR